MKEAYKAYLPLIFALLFVAGMFAGVVMFGALTGGRMLINETLGLKNRNYDKMNDVLDYITESYVDTIEREKLVDDAITALLSKLDPHSQYITAAEFNQMNESLLGNFEGIGVEFRVEHDTVIVMNTISGGPSEKVGVKAGDRIISVNDTIIAGVGITNQEVIRKLKGPEGTEVKVGIYRKSINNVVEFTITRDVIPTYSLDIAFMADKETGYIKLNRFGATTYDEFVEAVNKLNFKGMKNLILDLRGNGGGYLNAAINIADEFLDKKQLIVYTQGLNRPKKVEYARRGGLLLETPFVILIDEWSASASEVLAGALQDNDKGIIMGRRSFGKGLVQEQIDLADGSAIRLTVARYYTPTGRSIQRAYTNDSEAYYMDFYKRFLDESEWPTANDSLAGDTVKFFTPKGKVVFGGGGILPDINVPYEQEDPSGFYRNLSEKGVIYEFAFEYADNNRDALKKMYPTAKDYNAGLNFQGQLWTDFLAFAKSKGVEPSKETNQDAFTTIKSILKAYIGRNLYSNDAFYPNLLKYDKMYLKALEVLNDKSIYNSYVGSAE